MKIAQSTRPGILPMESNFRATLWILKEAHVEDLSDLDVFNTDHTQELFNGVVDMPNVGFYSLPKKMGRTGR